MRKSSLTSIVIVFLVCVVVFLSSRVAEASQAPSVNANSTLGANLHILTEWSSEYTFVDAFKQSRPWLTQSNGVWDTKESAKLDLDENGWVRSLPAADDTSTSYRWVATVLFHAIDGRYPAGQYTVLYDGEGTIEYGFDGQKDWAQSTDGRDIVNVTPGASKLGFFIKITETDPNGTGNYIRNIRVLMPGFSDADADRFNPTFLDNVRTYKVLRFMDWMRTNYDANGPMRSADQPQAEWQHPLADAESNPFLVQADNNGRSELIEWSDRASEADARYSTEDGVPVEVMVDLANEVSADAWFNMPHLASDDYIRNFATYVRNNLDSNRYVYIEYSNEVWNSSFAQSQWIEQQGMMEWPTSDASPLQKRLSWHGKRSAEMCNIVEEVFGPAQSDRVVCVIATQSANSWIGEQMLDCPLWDQAPCHSHNVDAVSIAPYFGQHIGNPAYQSIVEGWTYEWDGGLSKLFAELQYGNQLPDTVSKVNVQDAMDAMDTYAQLASDRNIDMVAYEGGQHLVGVGSAQWSAPIAELFATANRDQRMADIYTQYFAHWHAAGGHIHSHYASSGVYSIWGNWGAREYADSVNAPKQNAIDAYMTSSSCWWDTCYDARVSAPTAVTLSGMSTQANTASTMTMILGVILVGLCAVTLKLWKTTPNH